MRRLFAVALTVVLLFAMLCNISVFAASNTYDLNELELRVTIPNGYSVVTRDTPASDPVFSDFGTTKSAIISQFESGNIYLNAISNKYNEEVVVTMTENSFTSFSLLSDTELDALASTLASQYTNYGINVSRHDIYQHSQTKFIKMYFTDADKTVHGLQYYTICNGKATNFTMRSYEGNLSSRQETAIRTIVDSIKYDKAPAVTGQGEDNNPFLHTDTDSGVTFTVPANWKQKAFSKDRDYIDVKFVSTKEAGCIMIYGSTDMWEQLPASDRVGYTRSDINNSAFTSSDVAEMYGTTADKISTITYNGVEYFKGDINYTSDTYGVDITVTMTQLIYIDNGWMYLFQFSGASTHKLYSDFESLLKSVQYPTTSNVGIVDSTDNTTSNNLNYSDGSSDVITVIVLLVIVAIIIVFVTAFRKKNDKTTNYTQANNVSETPNKPEPVIYCTKCGQALPLDSDFCHRCGTEIDKEDLE